MSTKFARMSLFAVMMAFLGASHNAFAQSYDEFDAYGQHGSYDYAHSGDHHARYDSQDRHHQRWQRDGNRDRRFEDDVYDYDYGYYPADTQHESEVRVHDLGYGYYPVDQQNDSIQIYQPESIDSEVHSFSYSSTSVNGNTNVYVEINGVPVSGDDAARIDALLRASGVDTYVSNYNSIDDDDIDVFIDDMFDDDDCNCNDDDTIPADIQIAANDNYNYDSFNSNDDYSYADQDSNAYNSAGNNQYDAASVPVSNGSESYYARLTSTEQSIYDVLYKNAARFESVNTFNRHLDKDDVNRVVEALYLDHPELVWLKNAYSITTTTGYGVSTEVELSFNGLDQSDQADFLAAAEQILSTARSYRTDEEKEKFIYDYLAQKVDYADGKYDQSAYSALVQKETVCAGFAGAFNYMMNQLGIPTYTVNGSKNGGGHAWNIVKLNGRYYNVDATGTTSNGGRRAKIVSYKEYNISDAALARMGYTRDSDYDSRSVKAPACN